jgi:hypothetical protein
VIKLTFRWFAAEKTGVFRKFQKKSYKLSNSDPSRTNCAGPIKGVRHEGEWQSLADLGRGIYALGAKTLSVLEIQRFGIVVGGGLKI